MKYAFALTLSSMYSLYEIPLYAGDWPSLAKSSGNGTTTLSTAGPHTETIDILVTLLFTTALCDTLLYLSFVSTYQMVSLRNIINNYKSLDEKKMYMVLLGLLNRSRYKSIQILYYTFFFAADMTTNV